MKIERAINLLAGQRDAYGDCMSKEELEAYRMAIDALIKCETDYVWLLKLYGFMREE